MRSLAKNLLVLCALVASTACKHPESEESDGASTEAKEDHADGEDKEEKSEKAEKKPAKKVAKAHESEGAKKKTKAKEKEHVEAKTDDEKLQSLERPTPVVDQPADLLGKKEYDVPFIEGHRDPLMLTRGFLRDVLADNAKYMQKHDAPFFREFAAAQTPRATVITCSDSRVQTSAFDSTAENDDFMVRNIGNQLGNSEGSVEYGIHHLHTPVLFIMGHTGCGAVKAAMGDFSKESEAVSREISGIHVPSHRDGVRDEDPKLWLEAVVDNVNDQVNVAVAKFDDELSRGVLTIVGAVYDFRNDLHQGPGKVAIVNVNGVTDQAKLKAFTKSVGGTVAEDDPKASHDGHESHEAKEAAPALSSLSELRQALAHIPARPAPAEMASDVAEAAVAVAHVVPAERHAAPPAPKPAPEKHAVKESPQLPTKIATPPPPEEE